MRRAQFYFAASAAKTVATAAPSVLPTASSNGDVEHALTDLAAATKPARKTRVEVAEPPPSNFMPSASEAPELLQSYVEPKPFISQRRIQHFTVSLALGATTVGMVYLLLSKNISDCVEEEQHQVDLVRQQHAAAVRQRERLLKEFSAPSSYEELRSIMAERNERLDSQMGEITRGTGTLHREAVHMIKLWWNECLTNIQKAVDAFLVSQELRRDRVQNASIKATLRHQGYELLSIKKIE